MIQIDKISLSINIFNILDILTTLALKEQEGNLFIRKFFDNNMILEITLLKLLLIFFVSMYLNIAYKLYNQKFYYTVSKIIMYIFLLVVAWNLSIILGKFLI